MKIALKIKPAAKTEELKKLADGSYVASVKEPAKEGQANQALIKLLANHFKTSQQNIKIIIGRQSKQKIVAIN